MDLFTLILCSVFGGILLLQIFRLVKGPSVQTRHQVELALKARGLDLIDLKKRIRPRVGQSSRLILVARARNPFGSIRTEYFSVDGWADLFGRRSTLGELGTSMNLGNYQG